ncbi:hypothetical protein [Pontibacter sp. HSC-36F09]|nr:hypothetical protein [Pontibacter sp. HSC-36F09]MCP2042830.1 hypothetical protein [Pontibacter sp. HSC-36F09]
MVVGYRSVAGANRKHKNQSELAKNNSGYTCIRYSRHCYVC